MATFLGVLVGAAVTWLVSWWYYHRAGEELRKEAQELQRLTTMILQAVQQAGIAQVNWHEDGRPKGINITISPPAGTLTLEDLKAKAAITTPVQGVGRPKSDPG